MITLTLAVGQVNGSDFWLTQETYNGSIALRYDVDDYATDYSVGSHLGDGIYQFENIISATYRVYLSGSQLTKFGEIQVGESGAVLLLANNTISGNNSFTGTNTFRNITIPTGYDITLTDIPTTSTDAVNKTYADTKAGIDENNTFTGENTFSSETTYEALATYENYCPQCAEVPTEDNDLVNKLYVDSIEVTPFQESPNVIRLIPGGVATTAQVYLTYSSAVQYAKSVRASTRKMCIKVEGMGTSNTLIQISDGGISGQGYFENYISMIGLHQGITLKLPDDTLSFGSAGTATIENFTFIDTDGDSNNTFTNVTFKDCKFNLSGEVTFSGCTFSGVNLIKTVGNQTFTSCKGGTVYSTEAIPATVQGVGEIPSADIF